MTLFQFRLYPLVQIERDEIVGPLVLGSAIGCSYCDSGVCLSLPGRAVLTVLTSVCQDSPREPFFTNVAGRSMNNPPSPVLAAHIHPTPQTLAPSGPKSQTRLLSLTSFVLRERTLLLSSLHSKETSRRVAPSHNPPVGRSIHLFFFDTSVPGFSSIARYSRPVRLGASYYIFVKTEGQSNPLRAQSHTRARTRI